MTDMEYKYACAVKCVGMVVSSLRIIPKGLLDVTLRYLVEKKEETDNYRKELGYDPAPDSFACDSFAYKLDKKGRMRLDVTDELRALEVLGDWQERYFKHPSKQNAVLYEIAYRVAGMM